MRSTQLGIASLALLGTPQASAGAEWAYDEFTLFSEFTGPVLLALGFFV